MGRGKRRILRGRTEPRNVHEAWARAVLTELGFGSAKRRDERALAIGGKRIDAVVDFRREAPPQLLGRLAPLLAHRVVGFEFLSRGMDDEAWADGLGKATLLYPLVPRGAGRRVAVVSVCVDTSEGFVPMLDRWMRREPWREGAWHATAFEGIEYWVIDTEKLPAGEAASVWRLFTRVDTLRKDSKRIARLPFDPELDEYEASALRDRIMEALKRQRHHDIYDLTAAEIERLGFERGLTRGREEGRKEGRKEGLAEGRRALLALASRVLPPEVVTELESIQEISALEAEIERRLRHGA